MFQAAKAQQWSFGCRWGVGEIKDGGFSAGGAEKERRFVELFGIEEGFFPHKARKGAAVLTARTTFGMTCFFCEEPRMPPA